MPIVVTNTDGSQTVEFTDVTVTVSNFDPTTGACVLIITAAGGFGTIPVALAGAPGPPPNITVSMTQVPYGTALPSVNPVQTLVDPGGPGVPSTWNLNFYVNAGEPGTVGSFLLQLAEDILGAGEAVVGEILSVAGVGSGTDPLTFGFVSQLVSGVYWPTTLPGTTSSGGPDRTLSSVSIPPQNFQWFPLVFGQSIIIGGDGTAAVNLVARLNGTGGDIVATGVGVAAQTTPVVFVPGPPVGSALGYGAVPSGEAATVYMRTEQQGGTSADYTTAAAPDSTFMVLVCPVGTAS